MSLLPSRNYPWCWCMRTLCWLSIFSSVTQPVGSFVLSHDSSRISRASIADIKLRSAVPNDFPVQERFTIDPLLVAVYQQEDNEDDSRRTFLSSSLGGNILQASQGIRLWRLALTKGRLPTDDEFISGNQWPPSPLYQYIYDTMVRMQFPRLAKVHPETIPLILRSIIRKTLQYHRKLHESAETEMDANDDGMPAEEDPYYYNETYYFYNNDKEDDNSGKNDEYMSMSFEDDSNSLELIAQEVAQTFLDEWSPVLNGVNILDNMFGYDHGLLQVEEDEEEGRMGLSTQGFGVFDGVWGHSGWQQIPALQRQLDDLPELTHLVRNLGRRPTAENNDRMHKFAPRKLDPDGAMGAELDLQLRESVSGITLSASLSEMLPSEAVLLHGSSPIFRQLFLAKWAESKLLSYELSGYMDTPSVPRTRPLYLDRLPSAPGGPIIVCLDTSWSMSGARETLSKAVVLACVTQAHRHGRDCQVVAFSTERQVMESGIITADTYGIQRLLDFLSHSFGGGTDVTGALKFAILSLDDLENRDDLMSSADILLVTDGEIPDPPVPTSVMESLDRLKLKKGVEVHGLLVGKSESKPLARLCTCTHNFLANHFGLVATGNFGPMPESRNKPSRRMSTALFAAKQSLYDKDEAMRPGKSEKKGEKDRTEDKDDGSGENSSSGIFTSAMDASFPEMVERSVDMVREAAKGLVKKNQWNSQDLQKERKEATSWQHHKRLSTAVARVEDGLVERAEDARLVVLAMIASEHILLLGSPGTAKSVLGLRLAELCDGLFFQRLLTRFTMPEELFGPLSLRSLEQDEYRRVTAGFLPTADVAFLDEIFKANSAILNTLLTILNERKFDNAGIRESCPIRCVVGASNELPENDELVALFDRFLIRKEVKPVSDDGVLKLLSMKNPGKCTHTENGINHSSNGTASIMNLDDIINSLSVTADNVVMDEEACELMRDMRTFLREKLNVEISDRRLVKTTRLLKIVAASDGRQKVDMIDFLITQHCFWNRPEQRVAIREWLWENLTPLDRDGGTSVGQLRFLLNNLRQEIVEVLRKTNGEIDPSQGARAQDIAVIDSLADETRRVIDIIQEQHAQLARHLTLVSSDDFTWVDRDDVKAMQQLLLPRGDALWPGIQQLYENAYALSLAISNGTLSPSNEVRLAVIEALWDDDADAERPFTEDELEISMREAKAKYNLETFRRWKRAKKKAEKEK